MALNQTPLPVLRKKLNQRQMVMWLDWIVQIRRGHKLSAPDADYFCSKTLLRIMIRQVLDYCIGIDHVEALVRKGECATIEHRRPNARKTRLVIPHFGQRNAAPCNLVGMSVQGFETARRMRNWGL